MTRIEEVRTSAISPPSSAFYSSYSILFNGAKTKGKGRQYFN